MQNTTEQYNEYVGAGFTPLDQEEKADAGTIAKRAFFVVLAIVLGAAVGIALVRAFSGEPASASGSSVAVVATPTVAVAQPAASPTPAPAPAPAAAPAPPAPAASSGGGSSSGGHDDDAPATPALVSPADGVEVADTGVEVEMKWEKVTDPSGVRYRVEIDQWLGGGAGWGDLKHAKGLKSTHYHHTVGGLRERWRVVAVDGEGNESAPSDWRVIQPVAPGPAAPTFDLKDTEWVLSALSDGAGGMLDPFPGTSPTLMLKASGTLGGSTGLNSYSAPYTSGASDLHVGSITQTMMAGSPDVMKQEQYLKNALKKVESYTIEADFLKLYAPGGELVLVFQAVP